MRGGHSACMYHFITNNRVNLDILNGNESKNGKKTHFGAWEKSCFNFFEN